MLEVALCWRRLFKTKWTERSHCAWDKGWNAPSVVTSSFKDAGAALERMAYIWLFHILCLDTIFSSNNVKPGVFIFFNYERTTRCRPAGNLFIYYRQACWCTPLYLTKPIILQWPFLHQCHHTAVHEILMEMLAVLGLPGWVCCLTETYNSKAEATFKTVGATNNQRTTHTTSDKPPPQTQKAGGYQMRAAWNVALRHTPTSTNDVSYWHLLISHFISFYIRSPALFLWARPPVFY